MTAKTSITLQLRYYVDEADVDDDMAEADVDEADAGSDGGRDAGWDSESDVEAMDCDSA